MKMTEIKSEVLTQGPKRTYETPQITSCGRISNVFQGTASPNKFDVQGGACPPGDKVGPNHPRCGG